jgi:non-specific serine/threonine protein kinase/serine/threonine-protein kinase
VHSDPGGDNQETVRVGPYLLRERLGEGGSGEVYRAERVEDFAQTVAIKLLVHALGEQELRRFHAEQQVLASLNHPNIVRLLDAGVSAGQMPYIVMEYVEGVPLDQFCAERKLDLDSRLRLMIQVLDAVEHAHQRFLVHCDLKFSNILVTHDGSIKLLDFGITKLLRPAQYGIGESLTREFRPMTLEYASPEQLRGGSLSTATDVYACGVLLYGLLTGANPFEDVIAQPVALAEAIRSAEPEAPGDVARRLGTPPVLAALVDRDLDAITLKALRKEPEQRYRSAERFASDLRRFLDKLPVEAREDSFTYRAGKFVRRNRAAAIVAAGLALGVFLGATGTVLESIRAQQQRQRAEARFNDTRKLADSLLFGFYDLVSKLPGASHAQQLLVARSLTYLDSLAKEGGGNQELELDLADGYVKLASLQGSPYVNNAGLPKEALATADKAIRTASALAHTLPRDYRAYLTLASAYGAKGDVLLWLGEVPQSIDESRKAIQILDKLVAARPDDVAVLIEAATTYETLGDKLGGNGFASEADPAAAVVQYRRALSLMTDARKLAPGELRPRRGVVVEDMKIAGLVADADPERGLAQFNDAVRNLEALTPQELQQSASRRLRGSLLRRRAETEALLGRYDDADRDFGQVQQFTDSTLAIDPGDARAKWDLAVILHARGDLDQQRNRLAAAREFYERVVNLLETFPDVKVSGQVRASLDDALVGLGGILSKQKDTRAGATTERGLMDFKVLAGSANVSPEVLQMAANDFLDAEPAELQDVHFALDCLNRALARAKSPAAQANKARALARLGDKKGSREAAQAGLSMLAPAIPGATPRGLRLQLKQLAE